MPMATRFVGFCPCCEGTFKVQKGLLVHHGYERPGDGYIHGDCFSVGRTPHETSPDTAKAYLEMLKGIEAQLAKALENLPKVEMFLVEKRKVVDGKYVMRAERYETFLFEMKKSETPKYEWDQKMESEIRQLEARLDSVRRDVQRMQNHVDTWVLKPLKTWDEVVETVAAEKRARKAELDAERQAKVKARVAKFQQRIDSAVRRKNAHSLSRIWEKVNGDLAYELKMAKAEVFAAIDRDSVWNLFGLVSTSGNWRNPDDAAKSNQAILQKMNGYFQKEKFWPENK
jgi:chromosome segregation ATPase